jgi:hypothetical protein
MDKPRLVQVTDPFELAALGQLAGELDCPMCHFDEQYKVWVDPAELAQWRAGRKTLPSKGEQR